MSESDVVVRFSPTERARHWGFGLLYLSRLATGLPLMFPALRGGIRGYTPVVGFRLHLVCAALWIVVTLAVVALGDRRGLGRTWRELTAFGPGDLAWLRSFPRWLVTGAAARADMDSQVGRFNAGQKLNTWFVVTTSGMLLLTGLALVPIGGILPGALVTGHESVAMWRRAHSWLTLLVLVPLAGHVFLALVFPATRPSLGGMLTGLVDRDWAARHYPRWCREPRRKDEAA